MILFGTVIPIAPLPVRFVLSFLVKDVMATVPRLEEELLPLFVEESRG